MIILSDCCKAPVKIAGRTTLYNVCTKCDKACDEFQIKPETPCVICGQVYKNHDPKTLNCPVNYHSPGQSKFRP